MIIAIDPGLNGAIAYSLTDKFNHMKAIKMPESRKELLEFFIKHKSDNLLVYIEQQIVRPSDAKTGALWRVIDGLIRNYHDVLFCCESLDIRHVTISAREWQKKYVLPKNYQEKKQELSKIAKRKYPGLKPTLKTADAILLLEHGLIQKSYEG